MKKFFYLRAALWIAAAGTVKAADKEIYAVKSGSGDDVTMTLCFDEKREILGGVTNWLDWRNEVTEVSFSKSMEDARPTSTKMWFWDFAKLKKVTRIDRLNTSQVTDMAAMFEGCTSLTSLDLSTFNTANVTAMQDMFEGCTSLKELNLLWWDVWANVSTTHLMFGNCSALTTIYCNTRWWNGGALDPSQQFNFGSMFEGCTALKGGKGTECNGTDNIDILYAHPDGDNGEPGYFTYKEVPVEAYAALEADGTTMTFYYDSKRKVRYGKTSDWSAWNNLVTKVVFDESYKDVRPTSTANWFNSFFWLQTIEHLDYLNTEDVTDMNAMFTACKSLTSLDLSTFNTAKVTNMGAMFSNCFNLQSLDLSSFNTEKVTHMAYMFAYARKLETLNISSFNTANVTDMSYMFWETNLKTIDVHLFNTEKVTSMEGMFGSNKALETLNLRSFSTKVLDNTKFMFIACTALTTIVCEQDWNTSGIFTSDDMFKDCTALVGGNGTVCDGTNHLDKEYARPDETGKPGYFTGKMIYAVLEADGKTMTLYYDAERAAKGGVTDWTVDGSSGYNEVVTKVVFDESFKNAKPKSTNKWFGYFEKLESIEHLEYLNTEEVTNMGWMFYNCQALTSIDVSHFNTNKVVSMLRMFEECSALKRLDISNFNTEEVTSMCGMFAGCKALSSINVSNFDTKKVDDMDQMFSWCSSITMLNVNNFNVENVTVMSSMFQSCTALERIICDGDWSPTGAGVDMFVGCNKLVGGKGTTYDAEHTDETYAVTDGLNGKKGYFTSASDVFTVKFFDVDGNLLSSQLVIKGEAAEAPAEEDIPKIEHYHFTGWDKAFDNVTENLEITAQYAIDTFTVKFYDVNNHVVSTQTVEYGKAAVAPELPEVEGYHFVGWEDAFDVVTEDLKIYPIYEINTYTVTFVDWDGTVLKTQTVEHGSDATAPADPAREGYTFTGWDKTFNNVTSDLTVTAQYKQNPGTGIEEVGSETANAVRSEKILRDGRLYILIGDKTYDATGQMVK